MKASSFFRPNLPPAVLANTDTKRTIVKSTQDGLASPTYTAGVYTNTLSLSGVAGILKSLAVVTSDATPRVLTMKITIDGTEVYEKSSGSISAGGEGLVGAGSLDGNDYLLDTDCIAWNSSLLVELKSDLSGGSQTNTYVSYHYF